MKNFTFSCQTKIIFGKDVENMVGTEVKKYADKILLHYGGGSIKKNGLYDRIVLSLRNENIEFAELGGVLPNPRLSLIEKGIALCRDEGIYFILAVGGGSVIDSAKAIAMGIPYEGDNLWDIYTGKAEAQSAIPVGSVLTIPAAGSESSIFSVITNEETCQKIGYGNELLRPVFAFMNPELTYSLPDFQIACGCVDILMHTLERYFTNSTGVDLTDRLCEGLLKMMVDKTNRIFEQQENKYNYDMRAEIMWASSLSHNGLMETGRIGDFASHAIEHELSAIYDIAHGAGLSIIFPAWCRYVMKKHNQSKFIQFATRVMGVEMDYENPEHTAQEGIDRLEILFEKINMPVRLSEAGIGTERIREIADRCTANDSTKVGNYYPLNADDIVNILIMAK